MLAPESQTTGNCELSLEIAIDAQNLEGANNEILVASSLDSLSMVESVRKIAFAFRLYCLVVRFLFGVSLFVWSPTGTYDCGAGGESFGEKYPFLKSVA